MYTSSLLSQDRKTNRSILIWRIVQILVWLIGAIILINLIFFPDIGIHMFWNILIPVAPALVVVAIGVWRNVCPMASNSLLARHMGYSKKIKLSLDQSGKLNLIAVIALYLIVPLRHAIFDTNGWATAILIVSLAGIAIIMGLFFEWKSGWCSGLCPVHPVEKLYGLNSRLSVPNAHCNACSRCVSPCPDSTPRINPMAAKKTIYHRMAGILMVGAFPGFIWGWFHVPDNYGGLTAYQFFSVYMMPVIGFLISIALFLILKRYFKERILISLFAASAVSCYYWYRLPALVGFGIYPKDGMLVNLSHSIPKWSLTITVVVTTLFFFWWIVIRKPNKNMWARRPAYATNSKNKLLER